VLHIPFSFVSSERRSSQMMTQIFTVGANVSKQNKIHLYLTLVHLLPGGFYLELERKSVSKNAEQA
jgi:hypothetical protein